MRPCRDRPGVERGRRAIGARRRRDSRVRPEDDRRRVDDASSDDTAAVAAAHGALVLRLPFNVGIGGAVQTGFRYARDEGYEIAVRLDGDGQHVASELGKLLGPIRAGGADLVVGSRFVDPGGSYRPPFARRMGIRVFARLVIASRRAEGDGHDVRVRGA